MSTRGVLPGRAAVSGHAPARCRIPIVGHDRIDEVLVSRTVLVPQQRLDVPHGFASEQRSVFADPDFAWSFGVRDAAINRLDELAECDEGLGWRGGQGGFHIFIMVRGGRPMTALS